MSKNQRLKGKVALITGASRGIGAAIAKQYAREGAHVILAARTVGGLEEIDDVIQSEGGSATLVPLDLLEHDKIDQLGAMIAERYGRLDILVGNAAMLGDLTPVAHITPKIWDKVIAVNLTANYRLIRSMDALLRASDDGRAIFVTSDVVQSSSPYWGAYAVSKAGLESVVRSYAAESAHSNVRVNLVDPGAVKTHMLASTMPGKSLDEFPAPEEVTEMFVSLALSGNTDNGMVKKVA